MSPQLALILFISVFVYAAIILITLYLRAREKAWQRVLTDRKLQLWPKPQKVKRPWRKPKPWVVQYDLAYDGGETHWTGYYRTEIQARIASWWNCHISSWGGTAVLFYKGESNESRAMERPDSLR